MSTVTIRADKVFEDVLKAILREERVLERIEQVIIDKHRKWWNNWMYKGYTGQEIVDNSIHYGFQRAGIAVDIDKLEALSSMCAHAIQEGTTITLCHKDYELIYWEY